MSSPLITLLSVYCKSGRQAAPRKTACMLPGAIQWGSVKRKMQDAHKFIAVEVGCSIHTHPQGRELHCLSFCQAVLEVAFLPDIQFLPGFEISLFQNRREMVKPTSTAILWSVRHEDVAERLLQLSCC